MDPLRTAVHAEYDTLDPLRVRLATHRDYSEFPDDVDAAALDPADPRPGDDALDVGFGTGRFLRLIARHCNQVLGVDTAPAAVAAVRNEPGVTAVLGSATALPLADNSVDLVFARHMLYHVAEPLTALAEFRRVARRRVIVVVNHAEAVPHVMSLVRQEIARHTDVPPIAAVIDVHSDNLPGLMQSVFDDVHVRRHDNALVFPEPEPVIRFAHAVFTTCGLPPNSPARPAVAHAVDARVRAWFAEHDEPWRDPKGYSVCVGSI